MDSKTAMWQKSHQLLEDAFNGKAAALAQLENVVSHGREEQIAAARLGQQREGSRDVNVSLAAKKSLAKAPATKDWKHHPLTPWAIIASGPLLWLIMYQILSWPFVESLACFYSAFFMIGALVTGVIWKRIFKSDGGGKATKSKM